MPSVCQPDIESAFKNRLYETSEKFRLLILSVLSVAEGMESPNDQPHSGQSSSSSPTALQLLTRINGVPDDLSTLGFEHVFANITAFVSYDLRGDGAKAWFYLQQAITLAQLNGMDQTESYKPSEDHYRATLRMKVYYHL